MRVTIWVDMEGISGITVWEQVNHDEPQYQEGRKLLTEEVNAAVRGAYAAGAREIIVYDCHGAGGGYSFNSLLLADCDPRAEYIQGRHNFRYIEPLKQGCDAALLIGMHARAGTPDGVLCHTMSSQSWYNAWINDDLIGEGGIYAALCGSFDVPVAFVSGDAATCREVQALLGEQVAAAVVKQGISRFSARHLAPATARELIETKVKASLQNLSRLVPYKPSSPVTFTIDLASPDRANEFRGRANVEIANDRHVISRGENFWQCWDQVWEY